jgi:hypothetical protein
MDRWVNFGTCLFSKGVASLQPFPCLIHGHRNERTFFKTTKQYFMVNADDFANKVDILILPVWGCVCGLQFGLYMDGGTIGNLIVVILSILIIVLTIIKIFIANKSPQT